MIWRNPRSSVGIFLLFLLLSGPIGIQDQTGTVARASNDGAGFPHITSVTREHMGCPSPREVVVWGSGFTPQLSKRLRVDQSLIENSIYSAAWYEDRIIFRIPGTYIPWEHVYQFCIVSHGQPVSNVYSQRFLYHIEKSLPKVGLAGEEVVFTVFMLPDTSGQLAIKIGTFPMFITAWQGGDYGEIKAKIPAVLAAGEYEVYLQKGSDVVSDKIKFKVVKLPLPKKIIK
jgi:hypothetical protein